MQLVVLDTSFSVVQVIDSYDSLIWTERYADYGDFELVLPFLNGVLYYINFDNYLAIKESSTVMVIEQIEIETNIESGNKLKVSGRSLESILDRRIVWKQTILNGKLQNGVQKLLNENIIQPTDSSRKISNFTFEESSDTTITGLTIEAQYTGDNLFDVIKSICDVYGLGFRISLSDSGFVFSLYNGKDRSYDQIVNPYVIFSPMYDNLISSNYLDSTKNLKTVTLVAGEGEGTARKTKEVPIDSGAGSGLSRREMYTDARDISSTDGEETLTEAEYNSQLVERGKEKLTEYTRVTSAEGEADTHSTSFTYGEDYNVGDIVEVVNEYGIETKARVIEFIRSESESGYDMYPTFSIIE